MNDYIGIFEFLFIKRYKKRYFNLNILLLFAGEICNLIFNFRELP